MAHIIDAELRHERRRDDLIYAAISAIEAEGVGVGMGRMAELAGVSRPIFYRHFKDREELDELVRRRALALLMREVLPQFGFSRPPMKTLRGVTTAYVTWIVGHPRLHQFLESGSSGSGNVDHYAVMAKNEYITVISNYFAAIVELSDDDDRFRVPLASGMVGFADAVMRRWLMDAEPKMPAKELAEFLTVSLWMLLDGHLRSAGIIIDPDRPLEEVIWPVQPQHQAPA
ncbi:TetR family transcriptional regulator [Jatrophihabitans sp. GAS493]|uniref:TetR/AcrR family transcriptional regulator n=1 Tax=Jatrophihabitans sp. GAS493 TaxID=1907575 RepID=UPI000BB958A5|nr:TetR/AcrR family transcriptional regulator [Jatrophihabitans sp. GAS493]SOD72333.1 TetR family transcriptional regulator [Jatrophihabitans sp. GAS493]